MIRTLSIENFCSFRDTAEISLLVGKKAPGITSFRPSVIEDERLSTVMGIFGPNASGKTNLLKSLAFLSYFITGSYESKPNDKIPVDGYMPLGSDQPSNFTLEFESAGTVFRYTVSLTRHAVLTEKLSRRNPETGRYAFLLSRQASGDESVPKVEVGEDLDIPPTVIEHSLRPNASIISTALQTGNKKLEKWIMPIMAVTNVGRGGRFGHDSEHERIQQATDYFRQSPELLESVGSYLQRADIGISGFELKDVDAVDPKTGETEKIPYPFVTHPAGELAPFVLPLALDSSGTKRLYIVMMYILEALRGGTPAIIDELESDLHPHMIPWILRLFTTPALNPKHSQLLFTCHSVELLNELDKTQIYLVGKDPDDNVSAATRLGDIKGVRRDDNILNKYNAGVYGAVPEPA